MADSAPKACTQCGATPGKSGFSKAQWAKKEGRRCKTCVDAGDAPAEGAGNVDEVTAALEALDGPAPAASSKKKKNKKKKTVVVGPPSTPVRSLFPDGCPIGEIQNYRGSHAWRAESEEKKEEEANYEEACEQLRIGAEVHRQARQYAQANIKPGMLLSDITAMIEDTARVLVEEKGLEAGLAFPCGVSINDCAAHYTPNPGDKDVLGPNDVMKVDFGVHVQGRIIDCAWTWCQDPTFDNLLAAAKDATNTGIRAAGIDARLTEIGAEIQEAMESYEVELEGKTYTVKSITNLNGHSIDPYRIHGGKSVPMVGGGDCEDIMVEGEQYAIETFGSIRGTGKVWEEGACSHFMKNWNAPRVQLRLKKSKEQYKFIQNEFSTLAFCRRWMHRKGMDSEVGLNHLVDVGVVDAYPPLVDSPGSYVAQYEHTLFIKPTCKEVFSRGDDY